MPLNRFRNSGSSVSEMETIKFVYFQEKDGMLIGWLEDYPDYKTQGQTLDELEENLRDIFDDIDSGRIPHIRRYGELVIG